jgi:hypothetical protein
MTNKTVLVFKTNVQKPVEAQQLLGTLSLQFPKHRINFDLDDCDSILRIEGTDVEIGEVDAVLRAKGYFCGLLE